MTSLLVLLNLLILIIAIIWVLLKFPKGFFHNFLVFLFSTFFFSNLQLAFKEIGDVQLYRFTTIWPSVLFSSTPLVVFIFFSYLMQGRYKFHLFHLPLLIPILIGLINLVFYHIFLTNEEQAENIKDFIKNGWDKNVNMGYFGVGFSRIMRHSIGFIYSLYLLKIFSKFRMINREDFNKKNINKFCFYFLTSWVVINLLYFTLGVIELETNSLVGYITFFATLVSFLFFLFLVIYPSILLGYPIFFDSRKKKDSLSHNAFSSMDPLIIDEKLNHWEKNSTSYLNQNFTIRDLEKESGLDSEKIQYQLSRIKGLSYYSFIMNLRISHAIKLIEEGFLEKNSTTLLAKECGFINVRVFNNAFLNVLNCLPENYNSNGR